MKNAHAKICSYLALCFIVLAGCSQSSDTVNTPPVYSYTVSGTVRFVTPMTLPPDAKLMCVWPSGNQTSDSLPAAFGTATIDTGAKTFSISFSGVPPSQSAAIGDRHITLGYGHIILAAMPEVHTSSAFGPYHYLIYGTVNGTAMVYHTSDFVLQGMTWVNPLPQGYAVGIGGRAPSSTDDTVVQRSNSGLELVVDTSNIYLPKLIQGMSVFN